MPSSRLRNYKVAAAGSKCIPVVGFYYKQAITRTFGVTWNNDFLPMKLIHEGEKSQSWARV